MSLGEYTQLLHHYLLMETEFIVKIGRRFNLIGIIIQHKSFITFNGCYCLVQKRKNIFINIAGIHSQKI